MADNKEEGFNDAELQDIMSEIENLEREYEGDSSKVENTPVEEVQSTESEVSTEEVVATTLEEEFAGIDPVAVEAEEVVEAIEDNIVQFEPEETPTSEQQVEFHGAGKIDFSLSFQVAGKTADLKITKEGLVVSLDGMNLTIDEENGCTIEMEGGVKFSVPMGGQAKSSKAA